VRRKVSANVPGCPITSTLGWSGVLKLALNIRSGQLVYGASQEPGMDDVFVPSRACGPR